MRYQLIDENGRIRGQFRDEATAHEYAGDFVDLGYPVDVIETDD
jgi:hypothetical protein